MAFVKFMPDAVEPENVASPEADPVAVALNERRTRTVDVALPTTTGDAANDLRTRRLELPALVADIVAAKDLRMFAPALKSLEATADAAKDRRTRGLKVAVLATAIVAANDLRDMNEMPDAVATAFAEKRSFLRAVAEKLLETVALAVNETRATTGAATTSVSTMGVRSEVPGT